MIKTKDLRLSDQLLGINCKCKYIRNTNIITKLYTKSCIQVSFLWPKKKKKMVPKKKAEKKLNWIFCFYISFDAYLVLFQPASRDDVTF